VYSRKAIIVGCNGQDGIFLQQQLVSENFEVIGISRNGLSYLNCPSRHWNCTLTEPAQVRNLVREFQPDEIYYLAAFHHSSEQKVDVDLSDFYKHSHQIHTLGLLYFLEAMHHYCRFAKLFYASSCLIYSDSGEHSLNEASPYSPTGFYGLTKLEGMRLCEYFRDNFNIYACSGILFNHESYLRPEKYLSSKLIRAAIRARNGDNTKTFIGNPQALVDWGYAGDFVRAFRTMLRQSEPLDCVIATGELHSVEEFAKIAFECVGLQFDEYIVHDEEILIRKNIIRKADPSRIRSMGWAPSLNFTKMIQTTLHDTMKQLRNDP